MSDPSSKDSTKPLALLSVGASLTNYTKFSAPSRVIEANASDALLASPAKAGRIASSDDLSGAYEVPTCYSTRATAVEAARRRFMSYVSLNVPDLSTAFIPIHERFDGGWARSPGLYGLVTGCSWTDYASALSPSVLNRLICHALIERLGDGQLDEAGEGLIDLYRDQKHVASPDMPAIPTVSKKLPVGAINRVDRIPFDVESD